MLQSKIIQIIPSDGWRFIFGGRNIPVMAWAIVVDANEERRMTGMIYDPRCVNNEGIVAADDFFDGEYRYGNEPTYDTEEQSTSSSIERIKTSQYPNEGVPDRRLKRTLEYAAAVANFHGLIPEIVLSKIDRVYDSKGDMEVIWKEKPLRAEKQLLKLAWEGPAGDGGGATTHKIIRGYKSPSADITKGSSTNA